MCSHTSHCIYRVAQPTSFMALPLSFLSCCCCWVTQLNNTRVRLFETPWTAACQASLSITISQSLPKFMFIASVMPSSRLVLWRPLLLLPLIFPSIRDFSDESSIHIAWPKYWSFSFSISPSSEYSGLTSFKIDWYDLLAVQGTFRSLFQLYICSAFFMV